MPVRKFKATSAGRRFMSTSSFDDVTRDEPEKGLLESLPTSGGRNNQGKVTVRHRGGGRRLPTGKTSDWKKAVVTLQPGQRLEGLFGGV